MALLGLLFAQIVHFGGRFDLELTKEGNAIASLEAKVNARISGDTRELEEDSTYFT